MIELVQVTEKEIDGLKVQTVDARSLHAKLGVSSQFSHWIARRVEEYDFVEGKDHWSKMTIGNHGGKPAREYALTLSMAKELCMLEGGPLGKQVRQYFLECERRALEVIAQPIDSGVQQLFDRMLRLEARKASPKLWHADIIKSLCRTYRIDQKCPRGCEPGSDACVVEDHPAGWPSALSGVASWIYRVVLDPKVYAELRARNPGRGSDRKGLHYQFFQDCLRSVMSDDLRAIHVLSETSSSKDDFKDKMTAHYRKQPLQLQLSQKSGGAK